METVMLQFKHQGSAPSVEEVCHLFDIKTDEIDMQFGVIATDPTEGLYTVLVDVKAKERIQTVLDSRQKDPAEGIFANPRIEPFDTPEQ